MIDNIFISGRDEESCGGVIDSGADMEHFLELIVPIRNILTKKS
jgi:hypothetical protein